MQNALTFLTNAVLTIKKAIVIMLLTQNSISQLTVIIAVSVRMMVKLFGRAREVSLAFRLCSKCNLGVGPKLR